MTEPVQVLVGGVSELFQSDLDLGRLAVEQLRTEDLGRGVVVEELHYGAVAVAQRLEDLSPGTLVLVSAVRRDRRPGTVERCRLDPPALDVATVQAAVGDAVTGYVHPDLVVEIASAFGVLPARTVAVEVEPASTGSGEGLTAAAAAGLRTALDLVRTEVRRAPLVMLAAQIRPLLLDDRLEPSRALTVLHDLLDELEAVDRHGSWGRTSALGEAFRRAITEDASSEGMDHLDWGLWWALVEELDRLKPWEAVPG